MPWQDECVRMVRHMIDDFGTVANGVTTYRYDDNRLQELIIFAAQQVSQEADFRQPYTLDITTLTLTPDPTDPANRDESFINLSSLKAACTLDRSEARNAAGSAVSAKDARSAINLTGPAQYKLKFLAVGWCAAYATALEEYKADSNAIAGAAICSPFKIFSFGDYGGLYPGGGHASDGYRY